MLPNEPLVAYGSPTALKVGAEWVGSAKPRELNIGSPVLPYCVGVCKSGSGLPLAPLVVLKGSPAFEPKNADAEDIAEANGLLPLSSGSAAVRGGVEDIASGARSLPPFVPKRLAIPEARGVALSQARRVSIGLPRLDPSGSPCSGTAANRPPDASGFCEPLAIKEENMPCSGTEANRPPDASGCSEP